MGAKIKIFLILFFLGVTTIAVQACGSYASGGAKAAQGDQLKRHPQKEEQAAVVDLPLLKLEEPGKRIDYHFTKKEYVTSKVLDTTAIHYKNGIFLLEENGTKSYGLYTMEGTWDRKILTVSYMNFPTEASHNQVIFIQIVYDNDTQKFTETAIMPDGKKLLEKGTFKIS